MTTAATKEAPDPEFAKLVIQSLERIEAELAHVRSQQHSQSILTSGMNSRIKQFLGGENTKEEHTEFGKLKLKVDTHDKYLQRAIGLIIGLPLVGAALGTVIGKKIGQ